MSVFAKSAPRMDADAFMAWYDAQPEGQRFELFNGHVYEMQGERVAHGLVKLRVATSFLRQIDGAKLRCQVFGDGMAARVDADSVFEPDTLVRCGPRVPADTKLILDPMIVVEVLSPTTQHVDVFRKFNGYFRNPHIVHYVIVNSVDRHALHHFRTSDGRVESRMYTSGKIDFDPPGLTLELAEIFSDLVEE